MTDDTLVDQATLEPSNCRLISGTFALFVQGILGVAAGSTLYLKWRLEDPRRTFHVWIYDVSKQAVAGLFSHTMNVLIAAVLSGIEESSNVKSDECAWYLLNFVFDALFGLPLCWFAIRLVEKFAQYFGWPNLEHSGDYGNPPRFYRWLVQITTWTTIVVLVKFILAAPLYVYKDGITELGLQMFEPLHPYPQTELVLVMIVGPVLINLFQFWIFDQVLKKDGGCLGVCCKVRIGEGDCHPPEVETRHESEPLLAEHQENGNPNYTSPS